MTLNEKMDNLWHLIDKHFKNQVLQNSLALNLQDSMLYSISNGGKRFRPILMLLILEAFNIDLKKGLNTACALELIHTYSLIHDDLPAMDNDDFRRGKPTNHKVFGEALAILAGDALLTESFSLIAQDENLLSEVKVNLINQLSILSGRNGMIAGQVFDIEAETSPASLEHLQEIHKYKTGALIAFACKAAGIIAQQSIETLDKLTEFAYCLGLAFQIQDDILDVEGDASILGKPVGSDEANNKSTYVSLLGLENAKKKLNLEIQKAHTILDSIPVDVQMLKEITQFAAKRDK